MSPHVARRLLLLTVPIVLAFLQRGCAATASLAADPLAAAADETLDTDDRIAALDEAESDLASDEVDPEQFRETMKSLAWSRTERPPLRMRAIEALAAQDEDDTVRMLALMLPTESQWPVIRGVCSMASDQEWIGLTTGLVRSWSREVEEPSDADRPERVALAGLYPDTPLAEVVFEVFRDPGGSDLFRERARRDAWSLLTRIDQGGARTKELLAAGALPGDDPIIDALQAGARELHVAPATTPQLEWLQALRSEDRAAKWNQYRSLVAGLSVDQRSGLELRHLAALAWADEYQPDWLDETRARLLDQAERHLQNRDHVQRVAGAPDRKSARRETIDEWRSDLVWGDALAILAAMQAVEDESVIRDIFEYAGADRRDTTTEYGGVIDAAPVPGASAETPEPDFQATLYEPRPTQRGGDQRFIAPPEMIAASATALFHFHLQVQSVRNREYAGPSRGDIEYARTHGRSCLVFTSVSDDTMNVDYYQPNGARIDLGPVRRSD